MLGSVAFACTLGGPDPTVQMTNNPGSMISVDFARRLSYALVWGSVLAALIIAVTG